MTKNDILQFAKRLGFRVEVGNPGDGARRYEFTHTAIPYHTYRCVGSMNAFQFLRGFDAALDVHAREVK